jgi:hypothetical protein
MVYEIEGPALSHTRRVLRRNQRRPDSWLRVGTQPRRLQRYSSRAVLEHPKTESSLYSTEAGVYTLEAKRRRELRPSLSQSSSWFQVAKFRLTDPFGGRLDLHAGRAAPEDDRVVAWSRCAVASVGRQGRFARSRAACDFQIHRSGWVLFPVASANSFEAAPRDYLRVAGGDSLAHCQSTQPAHGSLSCQAIPTSSFDFSGEFHRVADHSGVVMFFRARR